MWVEVFDEKYWVDTDTGEGYRKVISKVEPHLNKLANKYRIHLFDYEDIKQEFREMQLKEAQKLIIPGQ